jgi:hypothetical protein
MADDQTSARFMGHAHGEVDQSHQQVPTNEEKERVLFQRNKAAVQLLKERAEELVHVPRARYLDDALPGMEGTVLMVTQRRRGGSFRPMLLYKMGSPLPPDALIRKCRMGTRDPDLPRELRRERFWLDVPPPWNEGDDTSFEAGGVWNPPVAATVATTPSPLAD